MMKNSKLSKLLVAGVSVAVLASAVAPMAFAEEEGSNVSEPTNAQLNVVVGIYNETRVNASTGTTDQWINIGSIKDVAKDGWVKNGSDENQLIPSTPIEIKVDGASDSTITWVESGKETLNIDSIVDFTALPEQYEVTGWAFTPYDGDSTNWNVTASNKGSITLKDLKESQAFKWTNTTNPYKYTAALKIQVKEKDFDIDSLTVNYNGNGADISTAGSFNRANGYSTVLDGTPSISGAKAYLTESITLPKYKIADGYYWAGAEVIVSDGAYIATTPNKVIKKVTYNQGDTIKLNDLGIAEYKKINTAASVHVLVNFGVVPKNAVTLQLTDTVYLLSKVNGKEVRTVTSPAVTAVGVNETARTTLNAYSGGKSVSSDKTVDLPEVVVLKKDVTNKDVKDTDYTFVGWEVVNGDRNILAETGKTAANYRFEDGKFNASIFKATPTASDTTVVVVPVFTKAVTKDVVTFDPMETPYEYIYQYVNGEKQPVKVRWADVYKDENGKAWAGGLFQDTKNGVAKMYSTVKNSSGEYFLDTTVNGVKGDYYFKEGVQDVTFTGIENDSFFTKGAFDATAYGLKTYKDDGFVYLVANGKVLRDYNGLWISPENVWYYLTKGCCQIPATGIFQNTKDETLFHVFANGKIDSTANGLKLYGDTWYNFVNGGCDTKAPTTVVEQDGAFFYVKAGVVDTTFSGEYEGHTFVNGWAAK